MSEHDEAVLRLASTAFDDDGWMSDAQDARLEWDGNGQTLHFCGEGSIDVGHAVSIILADQGKPQITNEMVEAGARVLHGAARADWDWLASTHPSKAYEWREQSRAVLEAALGGEA